MPIACQRGEKCIHITGAFIPLFSIVFRHGFLIDLKKALELLIGDNYWPYLYLFLGEALCIEVTHMKKKYMKLTK